MNFIIFLYNTLKLFCLRLVPLLARNPGVEVNGTHMEHHKVQWWRNIV